MIIRIPTELETSLTICLYIIIGIIVFLWGRAIGFNETAEAFKIADKKREIEKLRHENDNFIIENKSLKLENEKLRKWKKRIVNSIGIE